MVMKNVCIAKNVRLAVSVKSINLVSGSALLLLATAASLEVNLLSLNHRCCFEFIYLNSISSKTSICVFSYFISSQ